MSQINIFKKINRNAFSEKIIHRYLFERYYFGTTQQRRNLLPERFHKDKINLIVPEDSKSGTGYRADLTIYFKNQQVGVPVEVKWLLDEFSKNNQINYLKEKNGFLVILGDTLEKTIHGIEIIQIKHDDFSDWIAENISRLSRESLIYQAESKKLTDKNQYWVVLLRGNAPKVNFDRMLKSSSIRPFWAFKQNKEALKYILDMQRGDKILFLFGKAIGGAMGHSSNPNVKLKINSYYLCDIVEPYYMVLNENQGLFFEKGEKPINKREWPHFLDFNIKRRYEGKSLIFGKQGEYGIAFAHSCNYGGGTPYPLSRTQFEKLKDYLFKLVEKTDKKL